MVRSVSVRRTFVPGSTQGYGQYSLVICFLRAGHSFIRGHVRPRDGVEPLVHLIVRGLRPAQIRGAADCSCRWMLRLLRSLRFVLSHSAGCRGPKSVTTLTAQGGTAMH